MKHGSLFSGIGGFDLASEWMGWENVFHCEWEDFPQKVLKHYWPKAISYEDIRKTDFTIHRGQIDILTGGFPCQPYSQAGKRLGKEDERHLWPEMLRAIREIEPRWIVGENVLGIVNWSDGLVFEEVQTDLEAEGYEVQAFVLPAAGVDAPHQRYCVWFVAHSNNSNDGRVTGEDAKESREERISERNEIRESIESSKIQRPTSDTEGQQGQRMRSDRYGSQKDERREGQPQLKIGKDGSYEAVANSTFIRDTSSREGREIEGNRCQNNGKPKKWLKSTERINGLFTLEQSFTNANDKRLEGSEKQGSFRESEEKRSEQSPRFVRTDWQEFPTQPPICSRDDGLSGRLDGITFPKWRNESIKAYGNAVVPQLVLQIFKAIQEYEDKYA